MKDQNGFVEAGLAYWYRGRLIPIIRGGDGRDEEDEAEPLFVDVPALFNSAGEFVSYDLSGLEPQALAELVTALETQIAAVTADPLSHVSAEFSTAQLLDATQGAVAAVKAIKAELKSRTPSELTAEEQAEFDALGNTGEPAAAVEEPAVEEPVEEPAAVEEPVEEIAAAAAPQPTRGRMPRPTPEREPVETIPTGPSPVALVASGGCRDLTPGTPFTSERDIAEAMVRRHDTFGDTDLGTVEKYSIARATWKDAYPEDRRVDLSMKDEQSNWTTFANVTSPAQIKKALRDRIHETDLDPSSLVASGGLCAPVTPYYNLQFISVPVRPVMGALPSFVADRGGLRYARPAALSGVNVDTADGAVGIRSAAEDKAGGSAATKSCQVIPCPDFQETDVDIIYHCLQFGNLGARVFPELVAQWSNLVLAAHARLSESNLLSIIDAASTQVTAGNLGLGASASLFSQYLAAANGLRSRNRMDPEAVLRLLLPWWSVDLIVSDVIRTQFQRFETDQQRVIALFRSFNIEPTFYIDGANDRGQVFAAQTDGALLSFPPTVVGYLYPEASFLFLDAGMLELGIVRDSVLNRTNDFQIFGETFESVAFVGVESLAIESTVCDSGTVSLPASVTCPVDYSVS